MNGKNKNLLRAQKLKKLQQLRAESVQAYGYRFDRTHNAEEFAAAFSQLAVNEQSGETVKICGRIMKERNTWMFVDLEDQTGKVQLFCHKSNMPQEMHKRLRLLDRGDLIGVYGKPIRTQYGELSIMVEGWELLAKSLQPLPEAEVLADPELRYRHRYVDLILNKDSRQRLQKRAATISSMRSFLDQRGFLEVETPVLNVQASGAEAKPFSTHHSALDIEMHLRIAPEMYLKRLLIGGIEKVYEIGKNFRNEGISTRHNPEFTAIELYQSYGDVYDILKLTEELLRHVVLSVCGSARVQYQGVELDFESPLKVMTMTESIRVTCGVDVEDITEIADMRCVAAMLGVKLTDQETCGEIINEIFEQKVEHTLVQPTFITEYPLEVSVVQQHHRTRPGYTERFELFIFGRELANACSELNDPQEQKRRFELQQKKRNAGHEECPLPDLDFINAMEFGMPPMMGLGVGIDRLVMFLTDAASIRDIIAFPTMKPLPRVAELNDRLPSEEREVG
jgi:lysyl-tRNA synthetase class 2